MRHLIVAEFGTFVGLKSERVVVKTDGDLVREAPLRDLRTIKIVKPGVVISSDLVLECAVRGIKIYFTNFKGEAVSFVSGTAQHAVAKVRREQFLKFDSEIAREIAKTTVNAKVRNQRAVLLYFNKYIQKVDPSASNAITLAAQAMADYSQQVDQVDLGAENWRSTLMGLEGSAAAKYFATWPALGMSLAKRVGRGAKDPINAALNYGYAILQSHIWTAVVNAGLEPYVGFLHVDRPGKPSLVLDLMEEYRPWVVDRVVVKIMASREISEFDQTLRRRLIDEIERALSSRVVFSGKRVRLETVVQRRAYRLAGAFVANANYPPFLAKW